MSKKKHLMREIEILNDFQRNPSEHVLRCYGHWAEKDSTKLPREYVRSQMDQVSMVYCIVTELCDCTLHEWWKTNAGIKTPDIRMGKKLFYDVLSGVEALHAKKIFHRDLKPENILLKNGVAKIADFGLARRYSTNATTPLSSELGTRWFRSPQQDRSNSDNYTMKTDIYSLGQILRVLLLTPTKPESLNFEDYQKRLDSPQCWDKFLQEDPKLAITCMYMTFAEEDSRPDIQQVNELTNRYIHPTKDDATIITDHVFAKSGTTMHHLHFNALSFLEYKSVTKIELSNTLIYPNIFVAALAGHTLLANIKLSNVILEGAGFDDTKKIHLPKLYRYIIEGRTLKVLQKRSLAPFHFFFLDINRENENALSTFQRLPETHVVYENIIFLHSSSKCLHINLDDIGIPPALINSGKHYNKLHTFALEGCPAMLPIDKLPSSFQRLQSLVLNNVKCEPPNFRQFSNVFRLVLNFNSATEMHSNWIPSHNMQVLEFQNTKIILQRKPSLTKGEALKLTDCEITKADDNVCPNGRFEFQEVLVEWFTSKVSLETIINLLTCNCSKIMCVSQNWGSDITEFLATGKHFDFTEENAADFGTIMFMKRDCRWSVYKISHAKTPDFVQKNLKFFKIHEIIVPGFNNLAGYQMINSATNKRSYVLHINNSVPNGVQGLSSVILT